MPYKDKEERAANSKRYRETHKKRLAAQQKAWRENNKEHVSKYQREYRETHKQRILAKNRRWMAANPAKTQGQKQRKRARKTNATIELFDEQTVWEYWGYRCVYLWLYKRFNLGPYRSFGKRRPP